MNKCNSHKKITIGLIALSVFVCILMIVAVRVHYSCNQAKTDKDAAYQSSNTDGRYSDYRCNESLLTQTPDEALPIVIPPNWKEFFQQYPELAELTYRTQDRGRFETTEKVAQGTVCVNPIKKLGQKRAKRY